MTYWTATVERPDGAGWTVVGVFGTQDHPSPGARHIHGDTALEAAQLVLSHIWPIDLGEFNQRTDPGRWAAEREAKAGIADHRITVEVDKSRWWASGEGHRQLEPTRFTVAELRLNAVRTAAAELAAAQATLQQLVAQVRRARADVQHHKFLTEAYAEEAACAGVPTTDIAKARRKPRTAKTD